MRMDDGETLAATPASVAIPASARWCILRTGPARTLRLAASLQEAGYEAWAPVERSQRRFPRGSASRTIHAALTPTYVFVRERHLDAMRRIERMEVSSHPSFSIFRYFGATVFVPHHGLHALREMEQDSYRSTLPNTGKPAGQKPRGQAYTPGQVIVADKGPLAGLPCEVEHSDGRETTLRLRLFGRSSGIVKIETSKLRDNGVALVHSLPEQPTS